MAEMDERTLEGLEPFRRLRRDVDVLRMSVEHLMEGGSGSLPKTTVSGEATAARLGSASSDVSIMGLGRLGQLVLADKNYNGNFDPLTSTSWNGNAFSTSTGTINWQTAFGVPLGVKAVQIRVGLKDSSATAAAGILVLRARSTTTNNSFVIRSSAPSDVVNDQHGTVPVAADGTSYYSITASGVNTCTIWIFVIGWDI